MLKTYLSNDDINNTYGLSGSDILPYPATASPEDMANELVTFVNTNSELLSQEATVPEILQTLYVNSEERIDLLFFEILGGTAKEVLKDWFTPQIDASLELSIGLKFPTSILTPLDTDGNPIEGEHSILIFDTGTFSFNTQGDVGFHQELSASLNYPSQIGNTGIVIDFTNAKLDLSRNTNIPDADAAGYPIDFIGVYVQEASIGLPAFWNADPAASNVHIIGKDLLIGTGGFSGTICLVLDDPTDTNPPALATTIGDNGFSVSLDAFDITFDRNSVPLPNEPKSHFGVSPINPCN